MIDKEKIAIIGLNIARVIMVLESYNHNLNLLDELLSIFIELFVYNSVS